MHPLQLDDIDLRKNGLAFGHKGGNALDQGPARSAIHAGVARTDFRQAGKIAPKGMGRVRGSFTPQSLGADKDRDFDQLFFTAVRAEPPR